METDIRNNKGQFTRGNTGKPRGAKNKLSALKKERVEKVLNLLDETLEDDIMKLKSKERVELWSNLQEFIRPKLQRMNVDLNPPDDKITRITFEVVKADGKNS